VKWIVVALLALIPSLASAQMQPSGTFTPGHTVRAINSQGTAVSDAGGAGGSANFNTGYLTELGITAPGLPFGITDALTSAVGGYHQLMFGANSLGGGLISYNAYGAAALPLRFNINGATYDFPITLSGILGPNSSVIGDVPCFNNTAGSLLSNGCTTARFLNPSTAPITAVGPLVLAVNNNASKTAAQIYAMAFGGGTSTYDLIQAVGVIPSGSNLLVTNGIAAYLLNQNASIGNGTSQNATALFGVAVGAASNAATWGGNVLLQDNTTQSLSAFHNQKLTGFEIDVNSWDTTTSVYGLLLAGASGQQPALANAILIAQLDITHGSNPHALWTTGFQAGGGCCQIGVLISTAVLSTASSSSMPLEFLATNSSNVLHAATLTANPTNFTFVGGLPWVFDAGITAVLPTSAGGGGLFVCIDTSGVQYKKATCP
jgi:hypothetical protein